MPSIHRAIMALILFFIAIFSCLASPVDFTGRQPNSSSSLSSCAAAPLRIDQFTTFSGTTDEAPYVTFFLTNPNAGAPGKMLCTATFGPGGGTFNSTSYYSCEKPGTGFNYRSSGSTLSIFQYMVCASGAVNSPSDQIVIAASGSIATYSYPGESGGQHTESVIGSIGIPVAAVQDVRTLNGGKGRVNQMTDEEGGRNVTCGFVGPDEVVYTLGECDLDRGKISEGAPGL